MGPNARTAFGRRRVVRAAVGVRDFGQAQETQIPRQGRLRHLVPLGPKQLPQLLLALDTVTADDAEDRGVTLGFHGSGMYVMDDTARENGEKGGRTGAVEGGRGKDREIGRLADLE